MEVFDQIGNKFSIVPISDVSTIEGNEYTLSSSKNFLTIYTLNDLVFDQKPNTSDAGVFYNQSMTAIISNDLLRFNNQDVMILLYTLRDRIFIWGSKDFPVRCKCTPLISSISVELTSNSIFPLTFNQ
jgi:hypothetical protein